MSIKQLYAARVLCNRCATSQVEKYLEVRKIKPSKALDYVSPNNIKVSAIQLYITEDIPFHEYLMMVCDVLEKAAERGSQLVVFPEYIGLVPILSSKSIFDAGVKLCDNVLNERRESIGKTMTFFEKYLVDPLFESYFNLFSLLSLAHKIYIQAGTTIVKTRDGLFNRAYLFGPNGKVVMEQSKLHLSPQERLLGLKSGTHIGVAETKLGKIAILSGKDQRVFEAAKSARQLGTNFLLCPASFSIEEGEIIYQSGAFMRCQEQQLYAVCSWLTGDIFGLPFRGLSGIYSPLEASKLGNGIIAETESLKDDICLTTRIDLDRLGKEINLYTSDQNPIVDQLLAAEYSQPKTRNTPTLKNPPPQETEEQDEEGETGDLVTPGQ